MAALGLFCLHLFVTHAALYPDLLSRIDLLGALIGLALLLFMLARRNELLLRMDFLALLKSVEDARKIERIEFLNDQILLNGKFSSKVCLPFPSVFLFQPCPRTLPSTLPAVPTPTPICVPRWASSVPDWAAQVIGWASSASTD
jgi:hypothetical protein